MAIDYETLKNWPFPDLEQSYGARDTMLYALGVGCGHDPLDRGDLRFVYEEGLQALPTQAVVLGYPGFWLKDPGTGVDWRKVLHGEQGLVLHAPLPAAGTVVGRTRVTEILDKGAGKGALLFSEREVVDKASGRLLCTVTATTMRMYCAPQSRGLRLPASSWKRSVWSQSVWKRSAWKRSVWKRSVWSQSAWKQSVLK